MGNISLGLALVAGKNRVPRPATGNTALRTCRFTEFTSLIYEYVVSGWDWFCIVWQRDEPDKG